MQALARGMNPRHALPHHAERGPQRFTYTYEDIAEAAGLSVNTTKHFQAGCHPVTNLSTVAGYIVSHASRRRPRELTAVESASSLSISEDAWANRWPLFSLWHCGMPGCDGVLAQRGMCPKHGGGPEIIRIRNGYMQVLVGRRIELYHRLVVGCPRNLTVHHRDFNKLNNRVANLQVLTNEEHSALHRDELDRAGLTPFGYPKEGS